MIVKKFTAEKVFGYLDFDITFNGDITFLVGGNGSGKTTALKLMNALVNPNFKDLISMPFKSAVLTVEEGGKVVEISAVSDGNEKTLSLSGYHEKMVIPSFVNLELDYISHRGDKRDDMLDDLNRKYADHPFVNKISEIQSPIFLGLERRRENGGRSQEDYYFEREVWLSEKSKRVISAKRLIRGTLGASLMETEFLVQNSYRRIRELEDRQSSRLRDSILLSAFEYSSLNQDSLNIDKGFWQEKAGLLARQKEIREALSKIGVRDSRLSGEVDRFFVQITSLFESLSSSEKGVSIEWLLNKAQIERMSKIVEIIDDHKSKVDNLFRPINDFLNTVNNFFKDSGKKLEVDTVGQLIVKRPDGNKCTIEGLSSGERQLLVIFSHVFFSRFNGKSEVFIIDEPELSLHLGWQEKFAETIFSISPKAQFILATHSPEIVGINKDKAKSCR